MQQDLLIPNYCAEIARQQRIAFEELADDRSRRYYNSIGQSNHENMILLSAMPSHYQKFFNHHDVVSNIDVRMRDDVQ